MPTPTVWAAMAGLALLSTALAYILYFRILQAAGATNLLLVTLLIPAAALPLGAILLDEEIRTEQLVGMVLIGAALVLLDGRLTGLRRPAK
ncbi:MAG: EamA family transporter [Reyranella sp.]|nr:EamA family transporter [Reyranella sp.]